MKYRPILQRDSLTIIMVYFGTPVYVWVSAVQANVGGYLSERLRMNLSEHHNAVVCGHRPAPTTNYNVIDAG